MSIFKKMGLKQVADRLDKEMVYNIGRSYLMIYRNISEYLDKYNISPAKFNILLVVKHMGKDEGISQNKISKFLLVTDSNMTRMLDKLEREGYLRRVDKKGDRRTNLVQITKNGADLLEQAWGGYIKGIKSMINSHISGKEKASLNSILEKLQNAIEEYD